MPKGASANLRSQARALALQALYESDLAGHPVSASFEWLKEEAGVPEDSSAYACELTEGVTLHRDDIDKLIYKFAPAWPVRQLAVVDRNILRLALFEIRFGRGIPHKVAINEAVELAKTFGSESSPRFVNGVLGSAMDEMKETPAALEGESVLASSGTSPEGK